MNHKAAIKQVFTFLMVAILIGLVFLFGIKAISGIMKDTCDADEALFSKQINEFVNKYNTYGSDREEKMVLPCEHSFVCFVDKDIIGTSISIAANPGIVSNPMINQSILGNVSYNIFLIKDNVATPVGYSDKLIVGGGYNYLCMQPTGNKVAIRFIGKGRTTEINLPQVAGGV